MHRDRLGRVWALLILFPLTAPSQDGSRPVVSVIVPAACASRPGGANNAFPFTARPALHYQAFLSPEAFAHHEPGPLVIEGVAFRGTGQAGRRTSPEVEMRIGTLPGKGRLEDVATRFADNLGADALLVLARGPVAVGPSPEVKPDQRSLDVWDLELRFQRPFTYRRDRVLVLDLLVTAEDGPPTSFPLDAHQEPIAARLWAPPEAEEGKLQQSFGLVTRFLLRPRAASRPASQPAR